MSVYNLKSAGEGYRITKFDNDLNVEASYLVSWADCECPQGQRGKSCRHQKMLHLMREKVDTEWFFNYDLGTWDCSEPCENPTPPPKGAEEFAEALEDDVEKAIAESVGPPQPTPGERPKVRRRI